MLDIPKNNLKDAKEKLMIVFGIKIDRVKFITKLLPKKLEKTVKAASKVLVKQSVTFLKIQLLIDLFSFYN